MFPNAGPELGAQGPGLRYQLCHWLVNNWDQVYASLGLRFPSLQMGGLICLHVFELCARDCVAGRHTRRSQSLTFFRAQFDLLCVSEFRVSSVT